MFEAKMDELDHRIIDLLVLNSRASLKELGKATDLSSPSVADRVRRLEEKGLSDHLQ
jgi:Lrp/AsnC family leucine-responsive transcriptional regulator